VAATDERNFRETEKREIQNAQSMQSKRFARFYMPLCGTVYARRDKNGYCAFFDPAV
jgi:hypothetical protein